MPTADTSKCVFGASEFESIYHRFKAKRANALLTKGVLG
jgi:hypothetical protein